MQKIGQVSFYLFEKGVVFDSVLKEGILHKVDSDLYKVREFKLGDVHVKFICEQVITSADNPLWLDFINSRLSTNEKINFKRRYKRPSGLLLLNIDERVFAATFGTRGRFFLKSEKAIPDFGIRTAMNMCGNERLRQIKSSLHSVATQQIYRQVSKPSDSSVFGVRESEFLKYISGHVKDLDGVSLQGKDSLTIKIVGEEKLTWPRLIEYCKKFLLEYRKKEYKETFPNYISFERLSKEKEDRLNKKLIDELLMENFVNTHIAIPEFIPDDEYQFSYTNKSIRSNVIYPYLEISQLSKHFNLKDITLEKLLKKYIYAYSVAEDRVLSSKKWRVYDCMVYEVEDDGEYCILSEGIWRKIDLGFASKVNDFIENKIEEEDVDKSFKNINIYNTNRRKPINDEGVFNSIYCDMSERAMLFDRSKLKINNTLKNKEFCDILELKDSSKMSIIQVKQYSNPSSINYLFVQAKFYCEAFLHDETFLSDIREHIEKSNKKCSDSFLKYIPSEIKKISGRDYKVCLWFLVDKNKLVKKENLPFMAKYELMLTFERLTNILKYDSVTLSFIPVEKVGSIERIT